jgi:Cysteine rich repeat
MRTRSLAALVLLAACFGSAHAADAPAAGGAVVEACKADVEKLCPGVQPGEGRVAACLKGKHRQMSDGCKAAIKEQRRNKKAAAA